MNKSVRINVTALAFIILAGMSAGIDRARAELPNVILCMTDDQGWGDVGFNGHKTLRTPHLDAMAAGSLKFNRFYAAAPVCSPTRGSCLTGRHPYRYGIFSANVGHMPPREITLAEALKTKGYATGHFGKWHLGTLSKTDRSRNRGTGPNLVKHFSPPWTNGFDTCFSTESKVPTWDPLAQGAGKRTWWDPVKDPGKAPVYGSPYYTNGRQSSGDLTGDDSRLIMDRALSFIRTATKADKPFFAVIWFHAPHLPVVAGEKFTKPYQSLDKYKQHYYGCITALDAQIGRLRAELRKLDVAENTMVWYCSDNGPEGNRSAPGSAGKFRGRKRSLYEGGVRVPALLEWPAKITRARTTDIPCVTSDYYPTVLEAVGIKLPKQLPLDGISLMPLIRGEMKSRIRPIGFQSAGTATWVEDRYKLVVSSSRRNRKKKPAKQPSGTKLPPNKAELYDLLADPGETNNLASAQPAIVKRMKAELEAWQASCRKRQ